MRQADELRRARACAVIQRRARVWLALRAPPTRSPPRQASPRCTLGGCIILCCGLLILVMRCLVPMSHVVVPGAEAGEGGGVIPWTATGDEASHAPVARCEERAMRGALDGHAPAAAARDPGILPACEVCIIIALAAASCRLVMLAC